MRRDVQVAQVVAQRRANVRLAPPATQELRDFWDAFDVHRLQLRMQLGSSMGDASFGIGVLDLMLPDPTHEHGVIYARLQQRAWLDGEWDALEASIAQRMADLVADGLGWAAWGQLLRPLRAALVERSLNANVTDPRRARSALLGLGQILDHLSAFVGEALIDMSAAEELASAERASAERAAEPVAVEPVVAEEPAAEDPVVAQEPAAEEPAAYVPQTTTEGTIRLVLDAAPVALLAVSQDGVVVSANRQVEALLGYGRGQLDGTPVEQLVPTAQRGTHASLRAGYAAMPSARPMRPDKQIKALHRSGAEISVEVGLTPFSTESQRLVLAAVFEVSEQRHAAAQLRRTLDELRRSNEELEQFASVVSHDLQEPLRMVSSYTELLRQEYKGELDESADLYISYAVDGAQRLSRVVHELLMYSRVGSRSGSFVPTDTGQLVEVVLTDLTLQLNEADAEVEVEGRLPTIVADSSQLQLVFQNLISNAVKFGRVGVPPRVRVGAERRGEQWLFWVADNGVGIAEHHFERIFGLFQRLTRDEHEGSGIGLTVSRRIVERHGGKIRVESVVDEGSTFYFTLPLWPVTG